MVSLKRAVQALSPVHEGAPTPGTPTGWRDDAYSVRAALAHHAIAEPDATRRTPRRLAEFADGCSSLSAISYNTMLMVAFHLRDLLPVGLKQVVPDVNIKPKPAFGPRAVELVQTLRQSQYDVAMLSEVFEASTVAALMAGLPGYQFARGPAEKSEVVARAVIERMLESVPGFVGDAAAILNDVVGVLEDVANVASFGLLKLAKRELNMTLRLLSGGLVTATRKSVVARRSVEYDERGNLFLDLDTWSNKGANGLVIDTGVKGRDGGPGHVILVSTHLFNGGFDTTPDDQGRRYAVQSKQIAELRALLAELRASYPGAPWVIGGDFNIAGDSANYRKFTDLMGFGPAGDTVDLWAAVSRDAYGLRQGHTNFGDDVASGRIQQARYCTPGPAGTAAEGYCADRRRDADGESSRIDYVFVSRHRPEFTIRLLPTRPRRRFFPRADTSKDYEDSVVGSDHIGLEFNLLIKPS